MMARPSMSAAAVLFALATAACSFESADAQATSLAPENPIPAIAMAEGAQPERNYASACAPCHAGRGFGVQVLTDRSSAQRALIHEGTLLDAETIRTIVRSGMGAMPAMTKGEISDAELDGIIVELLRSGETGSQP